MDYMETLLLTIRQETSTEDILSQLAEEAAELAAAASKMARITKGTNPSTTSYGEALANLNEEAADVLTCMRVLGWLSDTESVRDGIIQGTIKYKTRRWAQRIRSRGCVHDD